MLSFKVMLISTSLLSAAAAVLMLKFSFPAISDFAVSEVPSIYDAVVSWLKPPYLYLVINCIIITIVASSKLQSKTDDDVSLSPHVLLQPTAVKSIGTDYPAAVYQYNGVVLNDSDSIGFDAKVEKGLEFDAYEHVDATEDRKIETVSSVVIVNGGGSGVAGDHANKENEYVIAKSTWTAPEKKDSSEYSPKPPVSARFGHRRNVKASPEGGKTALRVSKPKKQDTLESTWKTITEGRAIPLTRHLRKSDTWERDSHLHGGARHHCHQQEEKEEEKTPQKKTMTKAETFQDRTNTRSPSPGSTSSGGSGKLKREASPSQDELNRRVEAFIKKFNEDMRLQRQESLNQYMEMINRGAH